MNRSRRVLRGLLFFAVAFSLVVLTKISPGLAQGPELFVRDRLTGMSVQGTSLLWFATCGDEFSGTQSYLRRKGSQDSAETGTETLYLPAACQNDRVASANVVDDGINVYWLGGDGGVLSLPRTARAGTIPTQISHLAGGASGFPSCCSIAVDNTYIYWNEGTTVSRVAKAGGAAQSITTGTHFRDLRTTGDGTLYALDGAQLIMLQPSGATYSRQIVGSSVTAYTVDAARIYMARVDSGIYSLTSTAHDLSGYRVYYASTSSTALRVGSLVVDESNLYFYAMPEGGGGGRIYRFPRNGASGSVPTSINSDLLANVQLLTDGQYLFWTDYNTGIYRLRVNAAPVSAANGDIWITGIEVTQAIQTSDNLVPLVGYKPTVVRVYVQSREDSNGPWNNVIGQLVVSGSARPHAAPRITVSPSGSNQRVLDNSFTFLLDTAETAPGTRTLTVTIFPPAGRTEPNAGNNVRTLTITFGPTRHLTIWSYIYANGNNGVVPPSTDSTPNPNTGRPCVDVGSAPNGFFAPFSDLEADRQYVESIYPVTDLFLQQYPGSGTVAFDNSSCNSLDLARAGVARLFDMRWPRGTERGVIVQPEQFVPNGACCWGGNGNRLVNIMDFLADPGPTLGQEIAHSYGGLLWNHTWDASTHYPRTDGMVGSANDGPIGPYIGVKTRSGLQLYPGQNPDGTPAAWDIMSYHFAPPRWISPWTYCKLINYMSSGSTLCPTTVEGGGSASSEVASNTGATALPVTEPLTARIAASGAQVWLNPAKLLASSQGTFLYVAGSVREDGSVTLEPFEMINSVDDLASKEQGKTFSVNFEDEQGKSLTQLGFAVPPQHQHPAEQQNDPLGGAYRFSMYMPWIPTTRRITITNNGKVLAERKVTPNAPTIALAAFTAGQILSGKQPVSWAAQDVDGDKLTFSVWYSQDNGQTWIPILVNLTDATTTIDFDSLPGSDSALLRVLASDGVNTAEARSLTPFKVQRKAPEVHLTGPQNGSVFGVNQEFVASGIAVDMEDGPIIDPAAYIWTDDKAGSLGQGSWIVPHLKPGQHKMTLTVRDSDGNTATATVDVTIQEDVGPTPTVIPIKITNTPVTSAVCPPPRLVVGGMGRVLPGDPNLLRKTPGGDVIGKLPAGTIFKALEGPVCLDSVLFWRVDVNGQQGWTAEGKGADSYFVEPYSGPIPTTPAPPSNLSDCPPTHLVIGGQGRVLPGAPNRLRKAIGGDIIGQIPAGAIFKILEGPVCQGGILFWKVDYNGQQGWTAEAQSPDTYFVEPYNPQSPPAESTPIKPDAPPVAAVIAKGGGASYKSTDLNFCPATFQLMGDVYVSGPTTIVYQWELADGTPITKQETQTFKGENTYSIVSQWIVEKPGSYAFQIRLHILQPSSSYSSAVDIKFSCQGTPG